MAEEKEMTANKAMHATSLPAPRIMACVRENEMKMINAILVVIATIGLLCVISAFAISHAIYVQVKVLKTEMTLLENKAKADTLTQFADHACVFFGIAGAIQLVGALIGSAALRRAQRKREMRFPNQPSATH